MYQQRLGRKVSKYWEWDAMFQTLKILHFQQQCCWACNKNGFSYMKMIYTCGNFFMSHHKWNNEKNVDIRNRLHTHSFSVPNKDQSKFALLAKTLIFTGVFTSFDNQSDPHFVKQGIGFRLLKGLLHTYSDLYCLICIILEAYSRL